MAPVPGASSTAATLRSLLQPGRKVKQTTKQHSHPDSGLSLPLQSCKGSVGSDNAVPTNNSVIFSQTLCKTLCHRPGPIASYWPYGIWRFARQSVPAAHFFDGETVPAAGRKTAPAARRAQPAFAWATRLGGWRTLPWANATVSNAAPATPQRWQRRKRRASVGQPAGLTRWEGGSRSGAARQ